jgi:hypothetical protein
MNDHPDRSPTKGAIDVECNPNIRRLTVRIVILSQLASYLKYLLPRLSAPNIQLTIQVLDRLLEVNWNEVDQILDGVKSGGLREVAIVMPYWCDLDRIRQDLTDQFPSMYNRGILNITVDAR